VTRSALVVLVAEAEQAVAEHRALHDPAADRGVPAHVTILHPFRADVDEITAEQVASVAQKFESFEATFDAVGRFPGEVVFLVPEPISSFKALIGSIMTAFPDCPPYGGTHLDPEPHLTVGTSLEPTVANKLAEALTPNLSLKTYVDRLTLLVEDDDGNWTVDRSWPLGDET
jgi:2'-5' RNA ligase